MTFVSVWSTAGAGEELGLLLLAAFGAILPLVLVAMREPRTAPVFELGADRVRLPRTAELTDQVVLTYREIESLFVRPGSAGFLWVGTASGTFMYPRHRFQRPHDVEMLCAALQARIEARLPDGASRVENFARASDSALAAFGRPIPATVLLLTLVIVGTVITTALSQLNVFNLVHAGGLVKSLAVEQEQWWRVGAAPWLSMLPDGVIAATTIGVFGIMVERLFGAFHMLTIALLAIALGTAMTLLVGGTVSAGATPVAVGMFTALAFTTQGWRDKLPLGFQPPGLALILSGGLLLMLTYQLAMVDLSMLAGGALAGAIVTALRIKDDTRFPMRGASPWVMRLIALLGMLAVGGCLALAVINFLDPDPIEKTALLTVAKEKDWRGPREWNEMAWRIAVSEAPRARDLELSGVLAERAIRRADGLPEKIRTKQRNGITDTLATVRYRQHRFNEAIALERGVLESDPDAKYATQLARFLDGRLRVGSSTVTDGLPAIALQHHPSRGFGVIVRERPVEAPVVVWGVVRSDTDLKGLLRFSLNPSTPVEEVIWLRQRGTQPKWPADVHLEPADVVPGDDEWLGWSVDPAFVALASVTSTRAVEPTASSTAAGNKI